MNDVDELRALLAQESELSEADCDRLAYLLDQKPNALPQVEAELIALEPLRALPQPASPAPEAWSRCWDGIRKGTLDAPVTTPNNQNPSNQSPSNQDHSLLPSMGAQNSSVALALAVGIALILLMALNLQTPPVLPKSSTPPRAAPPGPGLDQPGAIDGAPLEIQASLPPADLELRSDASEALDVEISMDFGEGYVAWPVVGAMSEVGSSPVIWIEERKAR